MKHCNSTDSVGTASVSLIILAAGLGRRFGGGKQLATIGTTNKPLMYFSVMDAYQLGVRNLVLVINKQIEQTVATQFLPLLPNDLKVSLVLQQVNDLPEGSVACARQKPWGTVHALWSARHAVQAECVVINADDYYGPGAIRQLLLHFENCNDWAMVSYQLSNTLSEFGLVNRGVCEEKDGFLVTVKECLSIEKANSVIRGEVGGTAVILEPETPVSMNIWGFGPDIFACLEKGLIEFFTDLQERCQAEFYLPDQVMASIKADDKCVRVYPGRDKWQGITYPDDLVRLGEAFQLTEHHD
jgi:UTP-glucose-1-phosphate uridylyltransferase